MENIYIGSACFLGGIIFSICLYGIKRYKCSTCCNKNNTNTVNKFPSKIIPVKPFSNLSQINHTNDDNSRTYTKYSPQHNIEIYAGSLDSIIE